MRFCYNYIQENGEELHITIVTIIIIILNMNN